MRDAEWLRETLAALDRVFWDDALEAQGVTIDWKSFRSRSSFQYGCYWPDRRKISINAVFALDWVPNNVVAFTIFHETIHAMQDQESDFQHDEAFRATESRYPHIAAVLRWEEENHDALMAAKPPRRNR